MCQCAIGDLFSGSLSETVKRLFFLKALSEGIVKYMIWNTLKYLLLKRLKKPSSFQEI